MNQTNYKEILAVTRDFLETMDQEKLCELICSTTTRLLGCGSTHLYLVEGEGMILKAAIGIIDVPALSTRDLGEQLLTENGEIVETELSEALQEILTEPTQTDLSKFFPGSRVLATPLTTSYGEIGVLVALDDEQKRTFNGDDQIMMHEIGLSAAQALSVEHIIGERESRDGLTGLYNHLYFKNATEREVARIKRYGGEVALVIIDVDHFKNKNDTYGHLVGDDILKGIARFVAHLTRVTDVAARYGGEEFVVLLVHTSITSAKKYAERLRETVEQMQGWPEKTTVSCGVTSVKADDLPGGSDFGANELIAHADIALYSAKRLGRNKTIVNPVVPTKL